MTTAIGLSGSLLVSPWARAYLDCYMGSVIAWDVDAYGDGASAGVSDDQVRRTWGAIEAEKAS